MAAENDMNKLSAPLKCCHFVYPLCLTFSYHTLYGYCLNLGKKGHIRMPLIQCTSYGIYNKLACGIV